MGGKSTTISLGFKTLLPTHNRDDSRLRQLLPPEAARYLTEQRHGVTKTTDYDTSENAVSKSRLTANKIQQ